MIPLNHPLPHLSAEERAAIHDKARRARARAFRLFGILFRRALVRAARQVAVWLRHRLAQEPPVSPWLTHKF
jgi:hypothetical protein